MATHTTHGRHEEAYVRQAPPLRRMPRRKAAKGRGASQQQQADVNRVEHLVENTGRRLQNGLSRIPYIAAAGAGVGLFALASATGVSEIALSAVGAYAVLRLLRQRRESQPR